MTQQPWLAVTFAAVMIVTAAYCLTRLALSWRQRRPTDRSVDAVHVLMGVAMAGMLVPRLRVIPAGGWEVLFAACAALFVSRMARTTRAGNRAASAGAGAEHWPAHDIQHLLGCGAMVYMLAAMTGRGPTAGAVSGIAAGRVSGIAAGSVSGAAASAMSGAVGASGLALALAVALFGCVVWSADRISTLAPVAVLAGSATGSVRSHSAGPPAAGALSTSRVPLSPRLAGCCEIAMGVTMGYMLIVLL
jgi:hypothetical protein